MYFSGSTLGFYCYIYDNLLGSTNITKKYVRSAPNHYIPRNITLFLYSFLNNSE